MIRLEAVSAAGEQRIVYSDFFRTQRDNLLLLVESQDRMPFFDHVKQALHESIQEFVPQLHSAENPEPLLKEFFVQLNWKLHTLLGKALTASTIENPEHGLSLCFVLARGDQLWVVQFGRLLCCQVQGGEVTIVGEEWSNFAIRSREKMNLIGSRGEDIGVRVHAVNMPAGSRFLVVSSRIADDVREHGPSAGDVVQFLRLQTEPVSYAVFETERPRKRKRRSFIGSKPFRISGIVLIIIVVLSALYFFQCNNEVEDQLTVLRQLRQYMERNQDPDRVPEMLGQIARVMLPDADTLQISRIVDEARAFVTNPASSLALVQTWSMNLPGKVTLPPVFDDRRLFLVCGRQLFVYDKLAQKPLYDVTFEQPVRALLLSDANRLQVTTADGTTHSLKKDSGEKTWNTTGAPVEPKRNTPVPTQISSLDDRRLATGVLVFARSDQLQLVSVHTGKVVATWTPEDNAGVSLLSAFDPLEKSLYVISGDTVKKLWLEVR